MRAGIVDLEPMKAKPRDLVAIIEDLFSPVLDCCFSDRNHSGLKKLTRTGMGLKDCCTKTWHSFQECPAADCGANEINTCEIGRKYLEAVEAGPNDLYHAGTTSHESHQNLRKRPCLAKFIFLAFDLHHRSDSIHMVSSRSVRLQQKISFLP